MWTKRALDTVSPWTSSRTGACRMATQTLCGLSRWSMCTLWCYIHSHRVLDSQLGSAQTLHLAKRRLALREAQATAEHTLK